MARGCEWPGGCEADGVPEGVPVYHLTKLNSDEIDGDYCRIHARKRVREMGKARRAASQTAAPTSGEGSSCAEHI